MDLVMYFPVHVPDMPLHTFRGGTERYAFSSLTEHKGTPFPCHILWGHARPVLLSQISSLFAYGLLVESTLSYLGGELGVQEPTPSWGNMLALAREGFFHGHLLQALAPAAMIAVTLLGFSTLAAGLLQSLEGGR